jgi:sec-independent protein translocase protein TatC
VRMGLVSVEKFKEMRRYAVVVAFVISALVTPPDAISMLALAVPMCLLFELGLLLAPVFVRVSQAPKEADNAST